MADEEPKEIAELLAQLIKQPCCQFPAQGFEVKAPSQRGVYIIYSKEGKVLHVGSTPRAKGGLAQRLRDHLRGNSSFMDRKFPTTASCLRDCGFKYLVVDSSRSRALVEALGIGQLCPEHIGHGLDGSESNKPSQ